MSVASVTNIRYMSNMVIPHSKYHAEKNDVRIISIFTSLSMWPYFLLLWFVPAIGYWQSRHSHLFCTLRQKTSRSTMRQGPCLILKTVISKWVEEPDKSTIGYWKSQSIHVLCTLETTTTSTAQLPS